MMGFEAIEALGYTVVPVATLKDGAPAVFVKNQRVVLVQEDLDSVKRDAVVDWVLTEHGQTAASQEAADTVGLLRGVEHMLACLERLRKKPPVFHHTPAGPIATWPDITLPLGTATGPGVAQPALCGLTMQDVWLRADNPIVLDVLGSVRICKRCAASHDKTQAG